MPLNMLSAAWWACPYGWLMLSSSSMSKKLVAKLEGQHGASREAEYIPVVVNWTVTLCNARIFGLGVNQCHHERTVGEGCRRC